MVVGRLKEAMTIETERVFKPMRFRKDVKFENRADMDVQEKR